MPHYEVIFEDGSHAVAFYEDEAEMQAALAAHHDRAINGQPGNPQSTPRNDVDLPDPVRPAVRIKRVLEYDNHPGDYGVGEEHTPADIKKAVDAAIKENEADGTVGIHSVAAAVRDLSGPLVAERNKPHESVFLMEEKGEADLSFLEGSK